MSEAAEQHVRTCTHPEVKGGTRTLLQAIAELIPEGQTATPAIAIGDLALAARPELHERTARTCRDVLESLGVVRVIDGGRGKVARYEMLQLTGARPIENAPLPAWGGRRPGGRSDSGV